MLCIDVRSRMSAALDEHVDDEERAAIDEHLEKCAPCRAELAELEAVNAALKGAPTPEPPADYHENLWSRLRMTIDEQEKKPEKAEDSGLIEIRKMASRDIEAQEAARKREEEAAVAAVVATEIPPAMSQPIMVAAAPAAVAAAARGARPGWVVPVVGGGGLVAVAAIVAVVVMATGGQRPIVHGGPAVAPMAVPAALAEPAAAPEAPASQVAPGAIAMAGPTAAKPAAAAAPGEPTERKAKAERPKAEGAEPSRTREPKDKEPRAAMAAKVPAPAASGEPKIEAPKPAAKKGDDLDALLGGGGSAREEKKAAAPSEDDALPEALTQDQIKAGMAGIKGKVQACYEKLQVAGSAKVSLTIGKNGKPTGVGTIGDFAGTPTGDCVAGAVRAATFPRFKGKPLRLTYPFLLR